MILVRPRYAENVGAAARALENAGAGELRLVAPNETARAAIAERVARGGEARLREARTFPNLAEAIADVDLAVATSHKTGRHRRPLLPWELSGALARTLRPRSMALVFGPEDHGLSREEVDLCHRLVTIPSHGPLNLAQSVIVMLYEMQMRPFDVGHAPSPQVPPSMEGGAPDIAAAPSAAAPSVREMRDEERRRVREAPAPPGAVPRIVASASAALARTGYPRHKKPLQLEMARLADILARAPLATWEMNFLVGLFQHVEHWAAARDTANPPSRTDGDAPPP